MNRLATWLSILSLVLVGVLYYFHFNQADKSKIQISNRSNSDSGSTGQFKMAYFEMDSVDKNYEYLTEIKDNLRKKEENLNKQLSSLKNSYQQKIAAWQQKGANISQAESEAINREYQQMQLNYDNRQKQLGDELESERVRMLTDVHKKIADYLKEYNKVKGYNYIITDEQSLIYYKDSVYNITLDVVNGLNALYRQQKKKN